ncbi:MAG: Panacea domain-containing protein [Ignavibacteriaceae bacterium]|nr:Panacea domain-containing protein [Ignavibacteriaceae bacterium]
MYNQNQNRFILDDKKALATLLYVSQKVSNLYNIMKVIYFADKEHLSKYGRLIYGETYKAMKSGQVPSRVYDMIKFVRGDGTISFDNTIKEMFSIENDNKIIARTKPDINYLSDSDKIALDRAIGEYGKTHYIKLFSKSHKDSAYKKTELNKEISLENIVDSLDNKETVKKYLETLYC